jgi:GNAT superfamily N-acetyltransferase
MRDIAITIEGLPELLTIVSGLSNEVQEEVEGEILDSVLRITATQRRLAPVDQGGLRRNIGFERKQENDKAEFLIFSNSEQSGYIEFGTRYRVNIPAGLVGIAEPFQGPGIRTRLRAKEAIYGWAKRKGIPERAWYPIFLAIMTVGIIPHPFFFGPFFDESPKLLQRIETIINQNRTV